MGHLRVTHSEEEYERINGEREKQEKNNFREVKFECNFFVYFFFQLYCGITDQ